MEALDLCTHRVSTHFLLLMQSFHFVLFSSFSFRLVVGPPLRCGCCLSPTAVHSLSQHGFRPFGYFDRHGKITNESSSAGYAHLSKEFVVFVKVNWRKVIKVDTVKLVFSFCPFEENS